MLSTAKKKKNKNVKKGQILFSSGGLSTMDMMGIESLNFKESHEPKKDDEKESFVE